MSTGFEVPTIDISAFDGDDPAASARVVDAVRAEAEVEAGCSWFPMLAVRKHTGTFP